MLTISRDRDASAINSRFRLYATYVPLLAMVALWLLILAAEVVRQLRVAPLGMEGSDFAMFYSAAHLLRDGENLYNPSLLYRADLAVMRGAHLPVFRYPLLARVGNPPLFFWALQPLAALPYQLALDLWLLLTAGCLAIGGVAIARSLGWSRPALGLLIFLAPQAQVGLQDANLVQLIFAGIGLSLLFLRRLPLLAGAFLTVVWLKPQVGLPIAALILLFHAGAPRRALAGFVGGSLLGLVLMLHATGPTVCLWWLRSFTGYANAITAQADLVSLTGIYFRLAAPELRSLFEAVTLVAALALTAHGWWHTRLRRPLAPVTVAWLWFVWVLATPYAHFYDLILLTAPILALLGRNGARVGSPLGVVTLYVLFLCVVPYNEFPRQIQLMWLPTVIAAICLWCARTSDEVEQAPALQTVAEGEAGTAVGRHRQRRGVSPA